MRTILLRAGDFVDTAASGNRFDAMMAKIPGKRRFTCPGNPGNDHGWAILPDVPRAAVALAECGDRLPVFADIPFAGDTISGTGMAEMQQQAAPMAGRTDA